jgi:hypothetical protein
VKAKNPIQVLDSNDDSNGNNGNVTTDNRLKIDVELLPSTVLNESPYTRNMENPSRDQEIKLTVDESVESGFRCKQIKGFKISPETPFEKDGASSPLNGISIN